MHRGRGKNSQRQSRDSPCRSKIPAGESEQRQFLDRLCVNRPRRYEIRPKRTRLLCFASIFRWIRALEGVKIQENHLRTAAMTLRYTRSFHVAKSIREITRIAPTRALISCTAGVSGRPL